VEHPWLTDSRRLSRPGAGDARPLIGFHSSRTARREALRIPEACVKGPAIREIVPPCDDRENPPTDLAASLLVPGEQVQRVTQRGTL